MAGRRLSEVDHLIGANLRRLRLLHGLSQTDLANRLSLTFQQVQKYEKGTNRLSGSRIVQVCAIFKISPGELLGTAPGAATSINDPCLQLSNSRTGLELAQAFNALKSPSDRTMIVQFVERLARRP